MSMSEDEMETVLADFLSIDGLSAKGLIPWPMDIFRNDHLSVQDKLDMMPHLSQEAETLIELNYAGISGTSAENTAFTSAVRWCALGGYTFAGSNAVGGTYNIGNGGMTSLAIAILDETSCDRLFGVGVVGANQDDEGVNVETKDGRTLKAASVVCTIPF